MVGVVILVRIGEELGDELIGLVEGPEDEYREFAE
jgi:hypothetical protein